MIIFEITMLSAEKYFQLRELALCTQKYINSQMKNSFNIV